MPGVNLLVVTLPIGALALPWMPPRICWTCAHSSAADALVAASAAAQPDIGSTTSPTSAVAVAARMPRQRHNLPDMVRLDRTSPLLIRHPSTRTVQYIYMREIPRASET